VLASLPPPCINVSTVPRLRKTTHKENKKPTKDLDKKELTGRQHCQIDRCVHSACTWLAPACGSLVTALAPYALSTTSLALDPGGLSMAFCPLPFPPFTSLDSVKVMPLPELSMENLERGILVATFAQGSLGLLRICLGDVFSGSYTLLLATLGYNSRKPGPASNWLRTYVLISFINGTMAWVDLAQNMLLHNFPVVGLLLPLSANLAHMVQVLGPAASFLGAYFGWQHVKLQRRAIIEAYQQQMSMLMAQPPWPPPPLPLQIAGNIPVSSPYAVQLSQQVQVQGQSYPVPWQTLNGQNTAVPGAQNDQPGQSQEVDRESSRSKTESNIAEDQS